MGTAAAVAATKVRRISGSKSPFWQYRRIDLYGTISYRQRLEQGVLVPYVLKEIAAPYIELFANIVTIATLILILRELNNIRTDAKLNRKTKKTISFELTNKELQQKDLRYVLLHVRDGASDSLTVSRDRPYPMDKMNGNKYSATVEYNEGLGFEFKCFAENENYTSEKIKELLKEEDNFKSVSSEPSSHRAWFLLPGYTEVRTNEGIYNNYYGPRPR